MGLQNVKLMHLFDSTYYKNNCNKKLASEIEHTNDGSPAVLNLILVSEILIRLSLQVFQSLRIFFSIRLPIVSISPSPRLIASHH